MSPVWILKRLVSVFIKLMLVACRQLCHHCRNLAKGGCLLSWFHFTRCRYFLGHVACQNLPWQGLLVSWPIWACATEYGMLFRVLSPKQGIQFHCLDRVSFWTRSLKKSMKVGNEWSTSVVPTIFFLQNPKIYCWMITQVNENFNLLCINWSFIKLW